MGISPMSVTPPEELTLADGWAVAAGDGCDPGHSATVVLAGGMGLAAFPVGAPVRGGAAMFALAAPHRQAAVESGCPPQRSSDLYRERPPSHVRPCAGGSRTPKRYAAEICSAAGRRWRRRLRGPAGKPGGGDAVVGEDGGGDAAVAETGGGEGGYDNEELEEGG